MFDKKEIKQLKEIFATKGDLKNLATKEDVKKIIRSETKGFATKDDLKGLATKKDLKEEIDGLAIMVNNDFNENEKIIAGGFNSIRSEFKIVNEKLDKKVENVDKKMARIEEALVIK